MHLVPDEIVPIERDGLRFAFHVPSSAFFQLDDLSWKVLQAVQARGGLHSDEVHNGFGTDLGEDPAELDEVVQDLASLALLIPPGVESRRSALSDEPPAHGKLANLVLHVAHTCNLGCGYCYAEAGLYKGRATLMTPDRAIEYVDWLFEQADPSTKQLGITFFGGEPLLNPKVIRVAAAHALKKAEETGIGVRFGMTTNGTLVTPELADFLQEIRCFVTVSLDAVGKKNDRLRPFHSGKGSYDQVMDRIKPLLERRLAVCRVTVTKLNLDVIETVETLLDAGFAEVGAAPVEAGNKAYDLDGADYAKLLNQFRVLVDRYVEEALEGRKYGFSNIHNLLKSFHEGHNKEYPCGAGLQMVAGAPNGKMHLCHRFVGEEDYVLGSLQQGGIDEKKRSTTLEVINLKERSDCSTCWARYVCSGGCHYVNFLFEGDPQKTYLSHCDWLRAWYKLGLEAYARIQAGNPSFITNFVDPGYVCRN